jgi:BirA family transcriptional regulator, biotin operon repressor / biotin---[acetyl-CoA-carboxylase] ligase
MTMPQPLPQATTATAEACPVAWGSQALWEQLVVALPGLSVEVVARISSTNSALLERARVNNSLAHGASDAHNGLGSDAALVKRSTESRAFGRRAVDLQPCLLVAEHQTAGRGRHGHHWHSTPGSSLTFSLGLTLNPPDWAGLSLAVGVALAEALDPLTEDQPTPRLCIKWPNDLWLMDAADDTKDDVTANANLGRAGPGRKLGGVLIETVASGDKRLVVVGVGLNVLPMPLNPTQASTGSACLQELNAALDAPTALARLALPLVHALQAFERTGFAAFADRFATRDLLFQRRITTTQAGLAEGVALGVSSAGALQVQTAQGVQSVSSGEVSVRPLIEPLAAPC